MNEPRRDKKNNLLIIVAVMGVAVIVPGIFLLKNFLPSAGNGSGDSDKAQAETLKTIQAKMNSRKSMDKMDIGLFDGKKFTALRAYETKAFDPDNLQVGKANPFEK
jgi:hypothetical protein